MPRPTVEELGALVCPKCGLSLLRAGVGTVHVGVTEYNTYSLDAAGGVSLEGSHTEAEAGSDLWYTCGECDARLSGDAAAILRDTFNL